MRRSLPLLLLLCAASPAGPLTGERLPEARAKALRGKGGSAATEKAVAAALSWLARHQNEDGLWDADGFARAGGCECDSKGGGWHGEPVPCPFDLEVSALAALAFLGAGHTHLSAGPYRENLAGVLSRLADRRTSTLFATAFATQALVEAHDLTGDADLRPAILAGIAEMVESRLPDGGWRYRAGLRMPSGVPTTSAVVRALWAAEQAGFDVDPGYKQPVLDWLASLRDQETGRVKYHIGAERLGYTPTTTNAASALLIEALLDIPRGDPRIRRGVEVLGKRRPRWAIRFRRMKVQGVEREVQIGYLQHYYWHHGTEALVRIGGTAWSAWNGALKKALLSHQRKQGHLAGSFDPVGTYGKVGGRVYSTALCALMLEAYYR